MEQIGTYEMKAECHQAFLDICLHKLELVLRTKYAPSPRIDGRGFAKGRESPVGGLDVMHG